MGAVIQRLNCCSKKKATDSPNGQPTGKERQRVLRANDKLYNEAFQYADNFIKTSKYNVISFVPKNLFEQFNRLANFYFLMLMILQFWEVISPYSPVTTAVPLFFVLLFSAVKDATDDYQRHRSDNQVNNRKTETCRDGTLIESLWQHIHVGDVIKLSEDNFVAADMMILSTSEPHGLCYVETAELDGETNLKAKQALESTDTELAEDLRKITDFNGEITCEAPNNRLNTYEGTLTWQGNQYALDNDKLLLRGCVLRNTKWCYGLVIFAGKDTKLMMNSGKAAFKRTSLDRFLNVLIIGIVIFLVSMCLICTVLSGVWEWSTGKYFRDYLPWDDIIPSKAEGIESGKLAGSISVISALMFFSYAILLNTVVPISLYVSVEVIRFLHSWWINWDREMYYAKTDTPAHSRTTTLNEELGQVQYIFSDKTGTLTQNIMTFNKCSINGCVYGTPGLDSDETTANFTSSAERMDFSWNPYYESKFVFTDPTLLEDSKSKKEVQTFWRLLALCHTVMPDTRSEVLKYQAQSPDEEALTSAARNFGFVFKERTPRSITIEVRGQSETYQLLNILDFNNVRKRMSVIVKDAAGNITLYCKGADTMVLERLSDASAERLQDITMSHLDKFASEGLRTLCLSYKPLDEATYTDWARRAQQASVAINNRQEQLDAIYEEIEQDMTLIGATAIEDKLQDGVPETIANLTAANIKIWVLTGDKQETAINIGYSCHLLTENMAQVFVIDGDDTKDVETQLKRTKQQLDYYDSRKQMASQNDASSPTEGPGVPAVALINGDITQLTVQVDGESGNSEQTPWMRASNSNDEMLLDGEGFGLVVNGHSLIHALCPQLEHLFLEVACRCNAVICCRVTPLQKAMVVDLVKRNKNAVTLSIGDGANDVSMIKTAHIGVGISGQEGMQAVLSSDFSLAQFRFLERLLLVHGRWSYLRMSKFLRYFFYKNFAFTLAHFWYAFFCGYSAQTIFDEAFIGMYNLVFTSQPVLALGVFDQDVDDKYSLRFPKLYIPGQYNLFFNMRIFIYSVLHGIVSSLVLFFVPYGALSYASDSSGHDLSDYPTLAFTIFSCLVVVVSAQIALDTAYWTFWNHFFIWGSVIVYFSISLIYYQTFPPQYPWVATSTFWVAFECWGSWHYWLCIILTNVMLLMPVVGVRFFWQDTHPDLSDRLRIRQNLPRLGRRGLSELPMKTMKKRASLSRRSRRGSLRSGYAFSHQQGFGEMITMGKFWRRFEQQTGVGRPLSPVVEGDSSTPPPGLLVGLTPMVAGSKSNSSINTTSTRSASKHQLNQNNQT